MAEPLRHRQTKEAANASGTLSFHGVGNVLNNTISGGYGDDVLEGGIGNDTLIGYVWPFGVLGSTFSGKDTLDGGIGDDTLTGGDDIDTFKFANAWGNDTVTDFQVGVDRVDVTAVSGLTRFDQLSITDTAQGARVAFGGNSITFNGVTRAQLKAAEFGLPGAVAGQTLIGTADSDILTGGSGDDRLEGGDGMDFLTGGAGADQLLGGPGTDFLNVDADDTLIDGGEGFDYLYLDSSRPYGANFAVAGTNVEYVGGTLADDRIDASGVTYGVNINGNYGNDVVIGGAGDDRLNGSADNDTLTGGAGRDTLYFNGAWGNDIVTDFTDGQDVLDMTLVAGLTSIGQLTFTDTAAGASIAWLANTSRNLTISPSQPGGWRRRRRGGP